MPECPSLVANCNALSVSACKTLCKMCELSCNRCEVTTTSEPVSNRLPRLMMRSADFDLDLPNPEMSKCESESLDKPEVKCALSGEYEPMRCISVMSSSI